jgi:signal transduction histidine kinase
MPRTYRSLHAYALLWLVLPLSAVIAGLLITTAFAQRRLVTSLVIQQQRQLANLTAADISEVISGYVRVLETLAANAEVGSSPSGFEAVFEAAAHSLEVFNAGVLLVDEQGRLLSHHPAGAEPFSRDVSEEEYFLSLSDPDVSTFTSVLMDDRDGGAALVLAVPLTGEDGRFSGALLGALRLAGSGISAPVLRLSTSTDGFAYLVDARGRVILHPDPAQIGADFSKIPAVQAAIAGGSGGAIWDPPGGERLVLSYAGLGSPGWGLVVQNSWEMIFAPLRIYTLLAVLIALAAIAAFVLLAWSGVDRILAPIRLLSDQTSRLAGGESVSDFERSEIAEIDALENAFIRMAGQLADYRAGLRRYVGAITQSQEEERRRIARELHDETIQSLLAVLRRLELAQDSESDPDRLRRLAELQSVVTGTLEGLRQIIKDMRPLVLEDLGLVPALKDLVRAAHTGEGAVPHARLNVTGPPVDLRPEMELALYRITQEALSNVRKHARATGVRVDLAFLPGRVELEIADDGEGFAVPTSLAELGQHGRFGLMGIQERVWALEGDLSIRSETRQGTRLSVSIPVRDSAR